MNKNLKKLTSFTAVNFVIANMVGTGVYIAWISADIKILGHFNFMGYWRHYGFVWIFFVYGELGAAMSS